MATITIERVQAASEQPEVRAAALAILRRRDGRLRVTVPTPREAWAAVFRHYRLDPQEGWQQVRAARLGRADEATVRRVAVLEATYELVRAVPRFAELISGRDVSLPVLFALELSSDSIDWVYDQAAEVCRQHGLAPRGLERWARAWYGR